MATEEVRSVDAEEWWGLASAARDDVDTAVVAAGIARLLEAERQRKSVAAGIARLLLLAERQRKSDEEAEAQERHHMDLCDQQARRWRAAMKSAASVVAAAKAKARARVAEAKARAAHHSEQQRKCKRDGPGSWR